jgi:hypothetical protein
MHLGNELGGSLGWGLTSAGIREGRMLRCQIVIRSRNEEIYEEIHNREDSSVKFDRI